MIKKLIIVVILCMTSGIIVKAQSFEIVPQINYTFGGKIYGNFGELKIQDSESYGLALNIVNRDISFQIEYFYQPTTANYRDYFNPQLNESADLRVSWYQIGVRQRFGRDETVVPFGGLSAGLTYFSLDSSPKYNETALSFGLQGGANFYFSDRIGLRIHARLNFPVQFDGFGFYAGTNGSGAAASAGTYFIQADFGTGLIIRFSK